MLYTRGNLKQCTVVRCIHSHWDGTRNQWATVLPSSIIHSITLNSYLVQLHVPKMFWFSIYCWHSASQCWRSLTLSDELMTDECMHVWSSHFINHLNIFLCCLQMFHSAWKMIGRNCCKIPTKWATHFALNHLKASNNLTVLYIQRRVQSSKFSSM